MTCASADYRKATGCSPSACGRIVSDGVVPDGLVKILTNLAHKVMKITPGGTGPTIWDFNTGLLNCFQLNSVAHCIPLGALSFNDRFVDVFAYSKSEGIKLPLSIGDVDALETAVSLVKAELVNRFDLDERRLYLTSPSFFARIGGGSKAKTFNDEYWYGSCG